MRNQSQHERPTVFVLYLLLVLSFHVRLTKLHRLCHSDVNKLCQDVVEIAQVEPPTTPFEDLNRLTSHGQKETYNYPAALNYGVPKDRAMCIWQAFLNNEIKSEECSTALKTGMENVQKQLHFYHSNLMLLHILALFVAWSYYCYAIASEIGLSGIGLSSRSRTAVVFGPVLVSVLYICVSYPLVTTLAGGAGLLAWKAVYFQVVLTAVLLIRRIFTTPSEDEEEKQRCDSEDGYRRMGDDETVLYVAVPLQVV